MINLTRLQGRIRVSLFHKTGLLVAVLLALSVATLTVSAWSLKRHRTQSSQTRQRVMQKAFSRNDQVEITEVRTGQKVVKEGEAFDGDEDWLNTLSLKIKNVSAKPIVYMRVHFNFPETTATGNMMSYWVAFGQLPGSSLPPHGEPLLLNPGDSLSVTLDKHYSGIKSFVEQRHQTGDLHNVELDIGFIVFTDRTAWAASCFLQQDPANPARYINVGCPK